MIAGLKLSHTWAPQISFGTSMLFRYDFNTVLLMKSPAESSVQSKDPPAGWSVASGATREPLKESFSDQMHPAQTSERHKITLMQKDIDSKLKQI